MFPSGLSRLYTSDQRIVIFPANRNRNRFAEPTSVRIGIGIFCESQNNRNNIRQMGTICKLFKISEIFLLSYTILIISLSWLLNIFSLKNLTGKENYSAIYAHSLYIFQIKIRYSWILWKIFVNRNIICQITILANRNYIHEMKFGRIGIGIYSWPKYQRIDSWQINSQTICELFASMI